MPQMVTMAASIPRVRVAAACLALLLATLFLTATAADAAAAVQSSARRSLLQGAAHADPANRPRSPMLANLLPWTL